MHRDVSHIILVCASSPDELHGHLKRLETCLDDVAILAAIANKYHFVSTEKLALKILRNLLQKSSSHHVNTLTSDTLLCVFKSIARLNDPDLETNFIRMFAERVLDEDVKPQVVFEFAKSSHSMRPVLGAAYYTYLIDLKETLPTKNAATKLGVDQGCGDDDLRIRLLTGFWSLVQVFDHFCSELPLSEEIFERHSHLKSWFENYEADSDIKSGSADVLGLLASIREELDGEVGGVVKGADALAEFDKVIQTFKDNLMDHFDL
jgi:hypothetical protein